MDQGKIGEFIAELRKEKKLTQAELGDIVGVTGKAVSRWERGLNLPDTAIINKVSEVLGTTTTELLNGERVVDLDNQDLDKITENSINFYKSKLRKKFKKFSIILIGIIFLLLFIILGLFYLNNYNTCKVYDISSQSTELFAEGVITQTMNETKIVVSNFRYSGTKLMNVSSMKYRVYLDEEVIATGGYSNEELGYVDDQIDVHRFFSTITIYIDNNIKYNINEKSNFVVVFECIDKHGETVSYEAPLEITKDFSNNKVMYGW